MSADFFGAPEQEKCRAPVLSEAFIDVTCTGYVRPTVRIVGPAADKQMTP